MSARNALLAALSHVASGCEKQHSIEHSLITTFGRGRMCLGGWRVHW